MWKWIQRFFREMFSSRKRAEEKTVASSKTPSLLTPREIENGWEIETVNGATCKVHRPERVIEKLLKKK